MGSNVNIAFNDQTHLSGYGGYLLSKIIIMGIKKNVPELAKYIVDDFRGLDLSNLDPPPEYLRQSPGSRMLPRGSSGPVATPVAPGSRNN
jgi:hypothetical protein